MMMKFSYVITTVCSSCSTFSHHWDDVSSTHAGFADGGSSNICPVNHLVHTVVGQRDDHSVLKDTKDFIHVDDFQRVFCLELTYTEKKKLIHKKYFFTAKS